MNIARKAAGAAREPDLARPKATFAFTQANFTK